ncbi:MAG TPA: carboxypeptidase-like regulatory domain-containing protein, partial [Clostridia bacterium]|nr:carboxypeptidase-like regulatory domain-containing protein [Clostridia bacterium]
PRWAAGVNWKSKTCLWGWPLIHVASGIDPDTGKQRVAKGIIAIGGIARGGLAIGGIAMGFVSFGGLALGVVSFGGLGLGLLAFGGMALGLLAALGGGAAAPIAIGGGSVGYFAYGGGSYGVHAYSASRIDPVAWDFFEPWVGPLMQWFWMANFYVVGLVLLATILLPIWLARRKAHAPGWPVWALGIVVGTAIVSFATLLPKPLLRNINQIRYLLTGTVQDAQTGRPVDGARILVDGMLRYAGSRPWEPWTGDDGRFLLTIHTRKPTLTIWAPGYETNTVSIQPEAFSNKRRAEQHVKLERQRSASMETWAPVAGEEVSPDKILTEAKELTDKRRYEEALQRILWYFNHALEYQPSLSGVRLSSALSSWTELGRRYPKARQAMVETRDRDLATFRSGHGYFELFMELDALNRELDQENASLELFKRLHSEDKRLARQCYAIVESLLVNQREYQLCTNYITNPQAKFETIRTNWEHLKQWETNWARSQQENRRSSEQMRAKLRERYPNLPESAVTLTTPTPPQMADKSFVARTCELIEILVATHQTDAAKHIRDQAIALVDDPKLKSSLEDAKARIATK